MWAAIYTRNNMKEAHIQRHLTSIMMYHWLIHFSTMKRCTFKRARVYKRTLVHTAHTHTHTPIFNSKTRNTLICCGTLKIVHFRILIQFRFRFKTFIHVSELLCSFTSHHSIPFVYVCLPMSVIFFQCMKHGTY